MKIVSNVSEKEYRLFTENNNAHFLQSYEWGQVSKVRGLEPFYIALKNDTKIVATALLLKKSLPFGYSYFYIPRGYTIDYTNIELVNCFTKEIKEFVRKQRALFFRIDPDIKLHQIDKDASPILGSNNYELVSNLENIGFKRKKLTKYFETMQPRYTFRINLTDSIQNIEDRYTKTTNQRIRKAQNSGVFVERGSIDDLKEFIRLIKITEKRQNFYSHDENFYYNFYKEFSRNNMVTLYLGKVDINSLVECYSNNLDILKKEYEEIKDINSKKANNRKKELLNDIVSIKAQLEHYNNKTKEKVVVSSFLTVHYGNKSWALYGTNDMEYKSLFVNYLVYKYQIMDAKKLGSEVFDVFGTIGDPNSSSHLIGLHDFKKKWGGEYTEFIGEFDYVLKPFINFIYTKVIPIRRRIINKKLRRKGN